MVQMNFFVRQKQSHRCREWTGGHRGRRWGWDELGKEHWHEYTAMGRQLAGSHCMAQGTQLGALHWPREVGCGVKPEGGDMCICRCCSVAQSCHTLCNPLDCNTPGFPVLHSLLEFAQTHVHSISDASQPSHPSVNHLISSVIPFFSCPLFSPAQGLF